MKIEAVIVCWNYSDFLAHTLPYNLNSLDRIVVVTKTDDYKTKTVCDKFGIDWIDTEVMHDEGDRFNKGRCINLGLSHLRHDDWILHIDADVVLPHRFRDLLARAKIAKENLYGMDRLNVRSYKHWLQVKDKLEQWQWRYMVTPPHGLEVGARLLHAEYGYCPIGYFQLWHSSVHKKYPINAGSAEHSDVLFAVQWARERRLLLPEGFVYHIESEGAPMGANWKGRRTKPFGEGSSQEPSGSEGDYART